MMLFGNACIFVMWFQSPFSHRCQFNSEDISDTFGHISRHLIVPHIEYHLSATQGNSTLLTNNKPENSI